MGTVRCAAPEIDAEGLVLLPDGVTLELEAEALGSVALASVEVLEVAPMMPSVMGGRSGAVAVPLVISGGIAALGSATSRGHSQSRSAFRHGHGRHGADEEYEVESHDVWWTCVKSSSYNCEWSFEWIGGLSVERVSQEK